MTGAPRQDRNPYLQLDANVMYRRVDIWEGDMWQKLGTSRATSPWQLSDITSVTERIVGILGRQPQRGTLTFGCVVRASCCSSSPA
jgi:hypothetical protein